LKLSDLTPEQWYTRLDSKRRKQARSDRRWWQYVDLEQPLYYVARILLEQDYRFPPLLIAWPQLVLDSVDDRLTHEGFKLAGKDSPNDDLAKMWKGSGLNDTANEGYYAAAVGGESYVMVGPGDGLYPLMTIEYADKVAVEIDPRTRQPIAALLVWQADSTRRGDTLGALYLPGDEDRDGTVIEFENGKVVQGPKPLGAWSRIIAADPTLPSVPIAPMRNRPRRGCGHSDLVALKPVVDGANQVATNMMAGIEHHAVPRKWAVGVSQKDFVDERGEQLPLWKVATGDVWAVPHPKADRNAPDRRVELGQFSASDLRNFHESFKMLGQIAASLYGLPPNYMGYSSDNPPSAESILYSLDRLIRRTERRQDWNGTALQQGARIGWAIMEKDPVEVVGLESLWRDAATPTRASMMDAAIKGVTAGIIDDEQAWEDLGYSEETKNGLRQRKARRGQQTAADLTAFDQIPTTLPGLPTANSAPVLRS
jgi:hypothetical protein